MAGMSPHAFPIQNQRHLYLRSTPSLLRLTLTGRHRTITTCPNHSHSHRDLLPRPDNIILEYIIILPKA
jgi:hypothetical protein